MLCWGLVEQARHEYMSDEHKTRWYISNVPRFPSWAKVRGTTIKKNSNYIEHDNLKSIPALAPETIDQSSKTRVSGVPCFGFPTSIMEGL